MRFNLIKVAFITSFAIISMQTSLVAETKIASFNDYATAMQVSTAVARKEKKELIVAVTTALKRTMQHTAQKKAGKINIVVRDAVSGLTTKDSYTELLNAEKVEEVAVTNKAIKKTKKIIRFGDTTSQHKKRDKKTIVKKITIKKGDSLSKIAFKMYGSRNKYHKLYQANKDILPNPDNLKVGTVLKIPS